MPGDVGTVGRDTGAVASRKPWRTPHVIVSSLSDSSAKGPPSLEVLPSVTTTTGTSQS